MQLLQVARPNVHHLENVSANWSGRKNLKGEEKWPVVMQDCKKRDRVQDLGLGEDVIVEACAVLNSYRLQHI